MERIDELREMLDDVNSEARKLIDLRLQIERAIADELEANGEYRQSVGHVMFAQRAGKA